jgi:hypothetical protein
MNLNINVKTEVIRSSKNDNLKMYMGHGVKLHVL